MSLNDDLAAWAATVRLPDVGAAAIFRQIIASPAELAPASGPAAPPAAAAPKLKPSWWRGYNAGFAARMVTSTAPVRLAA